MRDVTLEITLTRSDERALREELDGEGVLTDAAVTVWLEARINDALDALRLKHGEAIERRRELEARATRGTDNKP